MIDCHRFQDIHQHAMSIQGWQQAYHQLSRGVLTSTLQQLAVGRFHVFRERLNQQVVQQGEAPRGRICFAVPMAVPGTAWLQGRRLDSNNLFVLRGGEEFMFHVPKETDIFALTFDQSRFDTLLDQDSAQAERLRTILRQPVIRVDADRLNRTRTELLDSFAWALAHDDANQDTQDTQARDEHLQRAMLDSVLSLLSHLEGQSPARANTSVHSYIVERCHRLALQQPDEPPSIASLCLQLRTNRRTVQNSFHTITGTTPLDYLRSLRLNAVRRELSQSSADELSIADAAARWGFVHMSHFAQQYRHLFDELPSQTRRASSHRAAA